jgi:RimJ/RimL family protein N-acetyltransferase
VKVELLSADDWQRLREARLQALKSDPEAFGGNFEKESQQSESEWRKRFDKEDYLVVSLDRRDVGMLYIEVLDGDHGTTCWIGGCWTNPDVRGRGAMRAMFDFIDRNAIVKEWARQGLGVWDENKSAINAYLSLGFEYAGELIPSSANPNKYFRHMVRNSRS